MEGEGMGWREVEEGREEGQGSKNWGKIGEGREENFVRRSEEGDKVAGWGVKGAGGMAYPLSTPTEPHYPHSTITLHKTKIHAHDSLVAK